MPRERFGYLLLAAGLGLIACGLYRQQAWSVLQKAITICLQCIGLG